MKQVVTALAIILITSASSMAQGVNGFYEGDQFNMEKYWFLRKRLKEKFVKIGLNLGESIPASEIKIDGDYVNGQPTQIFKRLDWGGDATTNLGWYIGVLATEAKLLRDAGEDNTATLQELLYAILAIERLDDYAERIWDYAPSSTCDVDGDGLMEQLWPTAPEVIWNSSGNYWEAQPGGSSGSLQRNGFILRMDGTLNQQFFDYFSDVDVLNMGVVRLCRLGNHLPEENWTNPSKLEYRNIGYWKQNEMSQDQVFHLLMGLMLTTEFVTESYNGESIKSRACVVARRLLGHYTEWWNLVNVVYDRNVCMGANSGAFIASLNHLVEYFETNGASKNTINDQVYFWTDNEVNRSLYAIVTAISNSTPHQDMCVYVTSDGFDWGIYYLLRMAIYGVYSHPTCQYSPNDVRQDLNACPCRGPYYDGFVYTEDGSYLTNGVWELQDSKPDQWFMPHSFLHNGEMAPWRGEFSGLDYMLLFNLAKIVYDDNAITVPYTDMVHHYFHGNLQSPTTYSPVGFIDLETDVVIPNGTRVDAVAGKSIILLPGFNSQNNFFLATIDSVWDCNAVTYKSSGVPGLPPRVTHHVINYDSSFSRNTVDQMNLLATPQLFDTLSEVVDGSNPQFIQLFPNPTNDIISINCSHDENIFLRVLDQQGHILINEMVGCGSQISLNHFVAGLYNFNLSWTDKKTDSYHQSNKTIVKSN